MAKEMRAELSKKNPYYITKHRYYEIKHWCLQYHDWLDEIRDICGISSPNYAEVHSFHPTDPTGKRAIELDEYVSHIRLIQRNCELAAGDIAPYLFHGVTEGIGYDRLYLMFQIPCCRDCYYDYYRKFFYLMHLAK